MVPVLCFRFLFHVSVVPRNQNPTNRDFKKNENEMKVEPQQIKKSAQEIQDDIFRKMSANRRLEVGAQLWRLARDLTSQNNEKVGTKRRRAKK